MPWNGSGLFGRSTDSTSLIGGNLWVNSRDEEGIRFVLTLWMNMIKI